MTSRVPLDLIAATLARGDAAQSLTRAQRSRIGLNASNQPRGVSNADYTVDPAVDHGVLILPGGLTAPRTVTLPPVSGLAGFIVGVGRIGTGDHNVTIAAQSGELIAGASTFVLRLRYQTVWLVCDNVRWNVAYSYEPVLSGVTGNWNWRRFVDGRMEADYYEEARSFTAAATVSEAVSLPAGFVSVPSLTPGGLCRSGTAGVNAPLSVFGSSTSTLTVRAYAASGTIDNIRDLSIIARGRWY